MFFVSQFIIRDLGSSKLEHKILSLIIMLSLNFTIQVLPFVSYEQINPHLPKFANKTNGTTRSREVPITLVRYSVAIYAMFQTVQQIYLILK